MSDPKKCWRCLDAPWARSEADKQETYSILTVLPHDCEGLEIKLRVPINICASCAYALKLKMEFECRVFRTKKRIEKEQKHGED